MSVISKTRRGIGTHLLSLVYNLEIEKTIRRFSPVMTSPSQLKIYPLKTLKPKKTKFYLKSSTSIPKKVNRELLA